MSLSDSIKDESVMDGVVNESVLETDDSVRRILLPDLATPAKPLAVPVQSHMEVFLRIRPLSSTEENRNEDQGCIKVETNTNLMTYAPKDSHTYKTHLYGLGKQNHKFTFSKIFPQNTTQKDFFDDTVLGKVKDFIEGQNCLVFTYGVTNSGKTHTVQGSAADAGILPRSLDVIFNSIQGQQWPDMKLKPRMFCDVARLSADEEECERLLKESVMKHGVDESIMEPEMSMITDVESSRMTVDSTMSDDSLSSRHSLLSNQSTRSHDRTDNIDDHGGRVKEEASVSVDGQGPILFSVWVSFIEIYNEQIFDLLDPPPKKKTERRQVRQLREDKNGTPYIKGLKEIKVSGADEAYKLLTIGKRNLQMACTKLNHNSSRSHCIFTIKMMRVVDKEKPSIARTSMLSFCDLAGSERYTKTKSTGDRIKEAGNINTSLLTLGRCIKVLRRNQTSKDARQIVPFRESKLTRIFQSFFCGKGKAAMIVNINQCATMFDETLHALKYSAIAKQVVVTQEPDKPIIEKTKKIPPKAKSSRFSYMFNQPANRESIDWATPGTLARTLAEEEEEEYDEDDYIFDEEEEDEVNEDKTAKLEEVIEVLKAQLLKSKEAMMQLELNIRNEVCEEMQQQLVEIDSDYSSRLDRERALLEEKHDRRIELLMESARRKRRRNDDCEEELVPSFLVHSAQTKLQDAEKRCQVYEDRAGGLKEDLKASREDQQKTLEELKKLQAEKNLASGDLCEVEKIASESQAAVEKAEQRLQDKEEQIRELQEILENSVKDCVSCKEHVSEMEELATRMDDTETENDRLQRELTKLQQVIDMLNCDIQEHGTEPKADCTSCAELGKKLDNLEQQQSNNRDSRVKELECELSEFQKERTEMEKAVSKISEEKAQLQSELEKKEAELKQSAASMVAEDEWQALLEAKDEELQSSCTKLMELSKEIQSLKTTMEKEGSKYQKMEAAIGEAKQEVQVAEKCTREKEHELASLRDEHEQAELHMKICIDELETSLISTIKEKKQTQDITDKLSKLRNSLSNRETRAGALEDSLMQANGIVREKTLLVGTLEEQLEASKSSILSLRKEWDQRNGELQLQLEDYIVKVNEQAEEIGELKEMKKAADKQITELTAVNKQSEASAQAGREISKKEWQEKEGQLEALEATVASERQTAHAKYEEVQNVLSSKNVIIEQLKSELKHTVAKLKVEGEKSTALHNQLQEIENQVMQIKSGDNEAQDKVALLTAKLSETVKKLAANQVTQEKLTGLLEEKERKINGLTMTVEMAEETEFIVEELKAEVETAQQELENEKKKCRKQEEHAEDVENKHSEVIADLQSKLQELEQKLQDTEHEYKMEIEQLKQDKEQCELFLSEAKESLEDIQENLSEKQAKFTKDKEELDKTLELEKKRCSKYEGALKELEKCLLSSKSGQDSAAEAVADYRQKSKRLEDEIENRDERILNLEDQLEVSEEKVQILQEQLERTREKITQLEVEISDPKLRDLESRLDEQCEHVVNLEDQLEDKNDRIEILEERICDLKQRLEEKNEAHVQTESAKIQQLQEDITNLKKEKETLNVKLETQTKEKLLALKQTKQENTELLVQAKDEAAKLQSKIESEVEKRRKLEEKIETVEQTMFEKENEKKSAESRCSVLSNDLKDVSARLVESDEQIEKERKLGETIKGKLADCECKVEELLNCLQEKDENISQMEQKISNKVAEFARLEHELENEKSQREQAAEDLVSMKEELKEQGEESKERLQEVVKVKEEAVKRLEANVTELEEKLEKAYELEKELVEQAQDIEKEHSRQLQQLTTGTRELETLQRKASETDDNIQLLTDEKEQLSLQLRQTQDRLSVVEEQLQAREVSIESYNKQVALLNDETKLLNQQMQRSQERESTLRGDLQEASRRQATTNEQCDRLTVELNESRTRLEQMSQESSTAKTQLLKLQTQVLNAETNAEEVGRQLQVLQKELTLAEKEVEDLKSEVERKDQRLKQRNKGVNDLLEKMTDERNNFDLQLQDAKANDRLLDELKLTLQEQETVMAQQDEYMQKRDRQMQQLTQDHEDICNKYTSLQDDNKQVLSQHKELERQFEDLTSKHANLCRKQSSAESERLSIGRHQEETESKLSELKNKLLHAQDESEQYHTRSSQAMESNRKLQRHIDTLQNDKAALNKDVQDLTKEVGGVEKRLEEVLKECTQLRNQLEVSQTKSLEKQKEDNSAHGQSQLLKQKFQVLEEQKAQVERERDHWKDQTGISEKRKEQELAKWREERDKLVSGLELVLKQKDTELKEMKKSDGGMQVDGEELRTLRLEMKAKDDFIQELTSQMDTPARQKRQRGVGRKRKTSSNSDEDPATVGFRKEIETLQHQMSLERDSHKSELNKVVRSKDQIIVEYKNQVQQLQCNMSLAPPQSHSQIQIHSQQSTEEITDYSNNSANEGESARKSKTKRAQPKKRSGKSEESEGVETDENKRPRRSSRAGGRPRRTKLKLDESQDAANLGSIEEEHVIDLDIVASTNIDKRVLTNTVNEDDVTVIPASPDEDRLSSFVSPVRSPKKKHSKTPRSTRKRRLHTQDEMMVENSPAQPSLEQVLSSPHEIVVRQLRSRRH